MSSIPLSLVSWSYDDATNRVVACFQDQPLPGDQSPASFTPGQFFTIEFVPQSIDGQVTALTPLPEPPAEEVPVDPQDPPTE